LNIGIPLLINTSTGNLRLLKKNIKINKIKNVTIVPKGVWEKKDTLHFYRKTGDHQSGSIDLKGEDRDSYDLHVDSLDNILNEAEVTHVDFMIIQLNGAEPEAIKGLTKVKPNNFSIAARYDKADIPATTQIRQELIARNYNVEIVKKKYLFASLEPKVSNNE